MPKDLPVPSNWRIALGPLLIATCIGLLWGIPKLQIYLKSGETPQTLSVASLFTKGAGNNLHITLTDLRFGEHVKAYENKEAKRWGLVFLPVFPSGTSNESTGPMVLVCTYEIEHEDQLKDFCKRSSVTGILVNNIKDHKLDQAELGTAYGRTDASQLAVLDCTEKVPNLSELALFWGLVIVCLPLTLLAIAKRIEEIRAADAALPDVSPPPAPAQARIRGVLSILAALILAKYCVLEVLSAAQRHESYIWWFPILAALCPAAITFGLYSVIAGKSLHAQFKDENGVITNKGILIEMVLAVLPALLLVGWLCVRLHDLGYSRDFIY